VTLHQWALVATGKMRMRGSSKW